MLIAQLSDTHLSEPGAMMDARYATAKHLERVVAHVLRLEPRPDVVWITGDLVDSGRPAEYARLRELLRPLPMPVFVIPGNHDERSAFRAAFAEHAWLQGPGEFLQFVVDDFPVRMIGLDSVIPGKAGGRLCAERLRWLEARLVEQPTRPTLLFLHHPPMRTGLAAMDDMGFEDPAPFERLLSKFAQVERVLCGHVHRPVTKRFANTLLLTCPSTAHQIALDLATPKLATVMEPPGILLHRWTPADGLVTHLSVLTSREPFTIFDGKDWEKNAPLPPGFYGEIKG